MIQDKTIDEALIELMRCKKALEALRSRRKHATEVVVSGSDIRRYVHHSECTKEHAAAKRGSLDLTRKLADLRAGR